MNIFEKVNFKELKELDLSDNEISDTKALDRVKFGKLEILGLSYNNISDKNSLRKSLKIKELYV